MAYSELGEQRTMLASTRICHPSFNVVYACGKDSTDIVKCSHTLILMIQIYK